MTDAIAWTEISLTLDGEGAEAVADLLLRYLPQGVAVEQRLEGEAWEGEGIPPGLLTVKGYLPHTAEAAATRLQIEQGLYYLSRIYPAIPAPVYREVYEEDWAEAWKKHFHPIRIGERILIKPAWIDVEPQAGDIVLDLDPGMAFGTGTHPTTQLCLMACEWFCKPDLSMVDIGTGSGILAIAAAKLGCTHILGREIDEIACRVARENVERNGVAGQITIQHGSIEGLVSSPRRFDLGFANITANVILGLLSEGMGHLVRPGGRFIFSGIIQEQATGLISALDAVGLDLIDRRDMGDWVLLVTQRRGPA